MQLLSDIRILLWALFSASFEAVLRNVLQSLIEKCRDIHAIRDSNPIVGSIAAAVLEMPRLRRRANTISDSNPLSGSIAFAELSRLCMQLCETNGLYLRFELLSDIRNLWALLQCRCFQREMRATILRFEYCSRCFRNAEITI
ncbi:hypothetical protein CEXT_403801 [Caerostris extrusa]|uniref:Uncharacterized protein n=1 Tax=Caerostris extrusa TaxID=172846 RepID=A0AAV4XNZ5_CAEEX|nr:hypothetical protein CEXT_403801 [Caerostris extrusa]